MPPANISKFDQQPLNMQSRSIETPVNFLNPINNDVTILDNTLLHTDIRVADIKK
jgi:hypothetical protein